MFRLFRSVLADEKRPTLGSTAPSASSSTADLYMHANGLSSNASLSTGMSTAQTAAQQTNVAELLEAKWFGGGNNGSPSTSDASCTSGSRQNGSHASSSAGWRTDAAAQARSGNERRAEPIVFSSRNVEELPPAAAGRMRNTPLAPNGQLLQNNSIGWTTRQTILLEQVPEHATAAGGTQDGPGPTPGSIVAMWLREQAAAAQQANGGTQGINLPSEDAVEDAAWRWRFARRWHAEQTRDIDPANASTSDRADDTLAGGQVWSDHAKLNVARTVSSELGSLVRNGSIVGVDLLLFESEGGWANRGERSVLQSQQSRSERELKAARLWDTPSAANMSLLPTVEIDAWGTFRFMVLKLSGLGGEERIMVHGHNHCTEASLVEEVNRKVMQLMGLQAAAGTLQVLGGGIVEWRRDRDRCMRMHSPYCLDTSYKPACQPTDLLNLAAGLVRESLPPGYVVAVGDGAR